MKLLSLLFTLTNGSFAIRSILQIYAGDFEWYTPILLALSASACGGCGAWLLVELFSRQQGE